VRWRWRKNWPVVALALGALAVPITHLAVDHFTRVPANYSRIEPGLWLGGRVEEPPSGTSAVLNLCELEDTFHVPEHRWEPIRDAAPAPSLDWLRQQADFIEEERAKGGVVYVHCLQGVSRGGMVVAAYLMRHKGWSRDRALEHLRARRPGVKPNKVFMKLLSEWEEALKE
jgi:hypothetical protein